MSDVVLFAESYGSVLFAPDVPCLIIQWHGFANSAQFRGLMDRGLAAFAARAEQPLGWVADTRQMSALTAADQAWLLADWNPRAYAAGIRHVPIVVSENIFGRIASDAYATSTAAIEHYAIQPIMQPTLAAAKHWLRAELLESGA